MDNPRTTSGSLKLHKSYNRLANTDIGVNGEGICASDIDCNFERIDQAITALSSGLPAGVEMIDGGSF